MKFAALRFILCAAVALTFALGASAQADMPCRARPAGSRRWRSRATSSSRRPSGTRIKLANGSKDNDLKENATS